MTAPSRAGAAYGLGAAALFGVSAPVAKLLLPNVSPLPLAALLYLGGGLALAAFSGGRRLARRTGAQVEAPIRRSDVPLLAAISIAGGMVGPVLMLLGLSRLSGVATSLLLNLEGPFTVLLAVLLFREHLGRRGLAAAALVFAGAAALGFAPGALRADPVGVALIGGACLAWAVDNNLSQRLSLKDPVAVVRIKALASGTLMALVSLAARQPVPSAGIALSALVLGALSYGASIVLDMRALRLLGAAREAAYFATAPFIGAIAAVPLLGERLRPLDALAGALMASGVVLLIRERHGHTHVHEALEHDHAHVHDEHHRHDHGGPVSEPHSHPHTHAPIAHDHPHVSDLHHRHRH